MKMCQKLVLASIGLCVFFAVGSVEANAGLRGRVESKLEKRRAIKSMHILDRPDRPGHFYGNTVRRRHRRGAGRLYSAEKTIHQH